MEKKMISSTESVCPICLDVIKAYRVERNGEIYLEKECPTHGAFSALVWEGDVDSYLAWNRGVGARDALKSPRPVEKGCPHDCGLCSQHIRKTCCVVFEITSRCDLGCPVCFANAGTGAAPDPSIDELKTRFEKLMSTGGPYNIQLSGGEPSVRDDLPEIIRIGREAGFRFFQLNTNGIRLGSERGFARILADAGLDCVFLQFDGLRDDIYMKLRGRKLLDIKKEAIKNCADAGLGVVLVPTVAIGTNDDSLGDILDFALQNMPIVRGVHIQPMSYFGRNPFDPNTRRMTIPSILRRIEEQTGGRFHASDFVGGAAENSYCSFHANYTKKGDGSIVLKKSNGSCCCGVSSDTSREFVANLWRAPKPMTALSGISAAYSADSLDRFLEDAQKRTFAVSGMLFMDAFTLDLERLKSCYISEYVGDGLMPFCAFNLTDTEGRSLYRK